jgi:hypothetical protein
MAVVVEVEVPLVVVPSSSCSLFSPHLRRSRRTKASIAQHLLVAWKHMQVDEVQADSEGKSRKPITYLMRVPREASAYPKE